MTGLDEAGSGGRRRRRAPRMRCVQPAAAPFITRRIPPYEMLSKEALTTIEAHADRLLGGIGLRDPRRPMSYEKFVLDLDQRGLMHVVAAGLALDANDFALDALQEVGLGKHFLRSAQTLRNDEMAFFDADLKAAMPDAIA